MNIPQIVHRMFDNPGAPPWHAWTKLVWVVIILIGLVVEIYGALSHSDFPTFTGVVKEYSPPLLRAAVIGVLGYHFIVQPIYEALAKAGINIF